MPLTNPYDIDPERPAPPGAAATGGLVAALMLLAAPAWADGPEQIGGPDEGYPPGAESSDHRTEAWPGQPETTGEEGYSPVAEPVPESFDGIEPGSPPDPDVEPSTVLLPDLGSGLDPVADLGLGLDPVPDLESGLGLRLGVEPDLDLGPEPDSVADLGVEPEPVVADPGLGLDPVAGLGVEPDLGLGPDPLPDEEPSLPVEDGAPEDSGGALARALGAGVVGERVATPLLQLMERSGAIAAGQAAKAGVSMAATVQLDPRQQRAVRAVTADPFGALDDLGEIASTLETPARSLARTTLSEVGGGLAGTGASLFLAPGGPAVQVPGAVAAKYLQKEHLDPALARLFAPEAPSSTIIAGVDGLPLRPPGEPELQNPLGERITSTVVDRQLTTVDGRPLTARTTPVLTTPSGAPLTRPGPLRRLVGTGPAPARPTSPEAARIVVPRSSPALRDGAVLVPGAAYGGAELRGFRAAQGPPVRVAADGFGLPQLAELTTTVPADVTGSVRPTGPGTFELLPAEFADVPFVSSPGSPASSTPFGRSRPALAGELAKQSTRAVATGVLGLPSTAVSAVDAVSSACVGAVCGVVGRVAENLTAGRAPATGLSTAARADGAANLTSRVLGGAMSPEEILTTGALTRAGQVAGDALLEARPARPPVRAASVGRAAVLLAAGPALDEIGRRTGLYVTDPLNAGGWDQTRNLLARTAVATALSSPPEMPFVAASTFVDVGKRETAVGRQLARNAVTESQSPDVVRRLGDAAADVVLNEVDAVGNAGQLLANGVVGTAQTIGTGGAIALDVLEDGRLSMPLSEYRQNLADMTGLVGVRQNLTDLAGNGRRFVGRYRDLLTGAAPADPSRPRTDSGYAICGENVTTACIRPGSWDSADPSSAGELVLGPQIVGPRPPRAAAPGGPTACDTARWVHCPGSPGHPAGRPRVGPATVGPAIVGPAVVGPAVVGPLYVGDGSGTDGVASGLRNLAARPQETLSGWVRQGVEQVVRDPAGALVRAAGLLIP